MRYEKDIPVEDIFSFSEPTTRRDFLKWCGFTVSAAVLAACEKAPVKYALPYTQKPAEVIPSIPLYYASSYFDGQIYQPVLVKVREGRPIKIEGNPDSSLVAGGTHARTQASVLSLYDHTRLRKPLINGKEASWESIAALIPQLKEQDAQRKLIYLITPTVISPSLESLIEEFVGSFQNARWVQYDAVAYDALIQAHALAFGIAGIPRYRFDKAQVIVSFGADFLGTWLSPVEFAHQWAQNRKLYGGKKNMSRHYQFEGIVSMTGANADVRVPLHPTQYAAALRSLYNLLATKAGVALLPSSDFSHPALERAAEDLWQAKGASLLVCGVNDLTLQLYTAAINTLLANYGNTLDLSTTCYLRRGNPKAFAAFIDDLEADRVGGVIFHHVNPIYDYPQAGRVQAALTKVPYTISIHTHLHETAQLCKYNLAESHYLESWGDAKPYEGYYSLQQPTIHPIFDTKSFGEILLLWMGKELSLREHLMQQWQKRLYPKNADEPFESWWVKVLAKGIWEEEKPAAALPTFRANLTEWVEKEPTGDPNELALVLYEKVSIGDGSQAGNPWLQEMPDPISRATWDNYITISPVLARERGIEAGDVLRLRVGESSWDLPVYVLPGNEPKTLGVALGYGRTAGGRSSINVGKNLYPAVPFQEGSPVYVAKGISIEKTKEKYTLARLQEWETPLNREYIRQTTLSEYVNNPSAGNYEDPKLISLWWKEHATLGHQWGMTIDLNSCIGCGACVVACVSENNTAVVGRDEIRRGRDMHWIRIDRYMSSQAQSEKAEEFPPAPPEDFPTYTFQPMLCQHCDHAPCETVCPVLAIAHSSEGLNQQVYNRCVGTRYCANNCPYKVRRFNWFDYTNPEAWPHNPVDDLGRMVLNPDVTVRARGVMEKCSFCVQRIQAAKLEAKKEGRPLRDGEVVPACAQACPTKAITFGDLKDPTSQVSQQASESRGYYALAEINVRPSVRYMVKVRNSENQTS
ncbi:MAG: 4Fe-4S dicluster domain-containing protein [Bacteroidia bacterium]